MKNGQFPEIIQLADLNGKNGFKLDGENNNDYGGFSVSAAGDINGDEHADLVIGAVGYPSGNSIGRSYVVFGGQGVGKTGELPLSSLNGSNGFKLDGENNNDHSGTFSAAGDINGDGYNDVLIGANWWDSARGRSYVVFGGQGVGKTGGLSLSSLNGANGFKLDGENHGDFSGQSLSAVGDINGDGYADLLIGAYNYPGAGRSYVVFGGPGVGQSGGLLLSSLNGANGFKLDGENNNDYSGYSVSAAGDINGDGYADLVIGSVGYPSGNCIGRSYVVFGGPGVGKTGGLPLSSLNGSNGFKLDGENNNDYSGYSISAAGDINGDGHNDLLIGARLYPAGSCKGRSYAVFGGPGVGQSGDLLLSSLNGANGFKLDGENNGDSSGQSVSAAGDINGDGYADLLIGAHGYPSGSGAKGRSYVVFGGPGVGQSGELLLSSLDGSNGFKLDGADNSNTDDSGRFVSAAGDINGDGVDDVLIGAYEYPSGAYKGRSYVVFGDVPPTLINNSLPLFSGETVLLSTSNLAAYDRNHDNSTLAFIPTNITHGQFELVSNPNVMIVNFTQQQIWDQQIQFVHDGSDEPPSYNITVRSSGIAWIGPISANITFNGFLKLENNQLVINQGETVVITSNNLKATHLGNVESDLIFLISNLTYGRFEFLSTPNQSITTFQQQNITDGIVRFVHDNSQSAPTYRVAVSNGTFTTSPQSALIDFDAEPILVRNTLTIRPGQTVTLITGNLYATHNGVADPNLLFIITDVQNGIFTIANNQANSFSQQQVMNRTVSFSQQGSGVSVPIYRVAVSDGRITTYPALARVSLNQGQFPEIIQLADLNGKNGFKLDGENSNDCSGFSVNTAGDINSDGYSDLFIGSPSYDGIKGRSYVVFGGPEVGNDGILSLSSLNGANGYKLDGENSGDDSGISLSSAGDINNDGYPDLLIGACHYSNDNGRSYVVFGGPGVGSNGLIQLSVLNGTNGFKLDGENSNGLSGLVVTSVGDINNDEIGDIAIGAPNAGSTGRNYVLFGGQKIGSNGLISLGSLDGKNGFILEGEVVQDMIAALSGIGDINDDGYTDMVASAMSVNGGVGRSYVIFGGPDVASNPVISLSSFNGVTGFKIDGETGNFWSGNSLSGNGDINGDGYKDLLIGAGWYNDQVGRSYALFGAPGLGSVGTFSLSNINGTNGFKLDGESINDFSGRSVSVVVDINNDGYSDILIGAPATDTQKIGYSYLVFGTSEVYTGGQFSLANLNGLNGFKLIGEMPGDYSGSAVSTAADVNADGVTDLLIGAWAYNNAVGRSYVVFGDIPPILVNNSLNVFKGEIISVTNSDLAAYDRNHDNTTLIFIPTSIIHGQFELISNPGVMISDFTQQQIWDQQIQFVHDGSDESPSYNITVHSEGIAWTGPISADITFSVGLTLLANQLMINQGQTVIITSTNLQASNLGKVDENLNFIISNLTHGKFTFTAKPDQPIFIFQQQNITDGIVQFVHDNTTSAPSYQVAVSNGTLTTPDQSALIDFDATPILLSNSLIINQGQMVLLNPGFLSATHPGGDDRVLLFKISSVMHGKFSFTTAPNQAIFSFYQQNITDQRIQFSHDNSTQAPSYLVSVSDVRITLPPVPADVDFDVSPILEVNQLVINQGQIVLLTDNNLRATQGDMVKNDLEFIISNIQHGQFSWTNNSTQSINQFYQQNISDRFIQFSHDNSTLAPGYQVTVSDGRIITLPAAAMIDFDVLPVLIHNQLTVGEGQRVTLTSANVLALHNGTADPALIFLATNVQNGAFALLPESHENFRSDITFSQQQVTTGQVVFFSQNSQAPAYQMAVTDGRLTTTAQSVQITFFYKPVITRNQFLISRGQAMPLTSDNIAATRNNSLAEDLQFIVSNAVVHGRFEQRNSPGSAISSFYQEDILQQNIQFVHDNSIAAPEYALKVLDNQGGMSSDTQAGTTLLVINNYFPINQGENLVVTPMMLNTTGSVGQNTSDIIFTPITGTMQHGYFALTASPDYPLTSFRQQQITLNVISFVPDHTDSAPSGYLTVSDGQTNGAQGVMACGIDFDVPPVLQNAYLKTSPGERVKITDVNLKANSKTAFVNNLMFDISDFNHGYFADNDDWQKSLSNFSQQRITNGDIIFVTDGSGQSPQFKVSVSDGRMHCTPCPQPAEIVFSGGGGGGDDSLSSTIKSSLIGALVSGGVGFLFFALKWYLNYKHQLHLQRTVMPTIDGAAENTYSDAVLLPIAREIFSRIKISGCLGYISREQYNEYVGAVSRIVAALETRGVLRPNQWTDLPRPQKQNIIDAVAEQTKRLVGNNRCCSLRTLTSMYRAEATPKMIREKAETIAEAVQDSLLELEDNKKQGNRNLRLTRTANSLQSQMNTPFLS